MGTFIRKTDEQIHLDVLEELQWEMRLRATDIVVAVDTAVVTLTGAVACWRARFAAQQAAHRVSGVRDVANDITVAGSNGPADREIAKDSSESPS